MHCLCCFCFKTPRISAGKRTAHLGCLYQDIYQADPRSASGDTLTLFNHDSATGFHKNEPIASEFTDSLAGDILCYNTNYSAVFGYSQVYRNTAYVWNETDSKEEFTFHIYTRSTNYLIPESATYASDTEVIRYDELSSSGIDMPPEQNSNNFNINGPEKPSTDAAIAFLYKNSNNQDGSEWAEGKFINSFHEVINTVSASS